MTYSYYVNPCIILSSYLVRMELFLLLLFCSDALGPSVVGNPGKYFLHLCMIILIDCMLGLGDPGGSGVHANQQSELTSGTCPCYWSQFENKCYRYFENKTTWEEAGAACLAEGGDLAAIHSEKENDFVHQLSNDTQEDFWIGANDHDKDRSWVWRDGSDWQYSNWARVTGHWWLQSCGQIFATDGTLGGRPYHGGEWHIANCSLKYSFVCEQPISTTPVPSPCFTPSTTSRTPQIASMPLDSSTAMTTENPPADSSTITKSSTPMPSALIAESTPVNSSSTTTSIISPTHTTSAIDQITKTTTTTSQNITTLHQTKPKALTTSKTEPTTTIASPTTSSPNITGQKSTTQLVTTSSSIIYSTKATESYTASPPISGILTSTH